MAHRFRLIKLLLELYPPRMALRLHLYSEDPEEAAAFNQQCLIIFVIAIPILSYCGLSFWRSCVLAFVIAWPILGLIASVGFFWPPPE